MPGLSFLYFDELHLQLLDLFFGSLNFLYFLAFLLEAHINVFFSCLHGHFKLSVAFLKTALLIFELILEQIETKHVGLVILKSYANSFCSLYLFIDSHAHGLPLRMLLVSLGQ